MSQITHFLVVTFLSWKLGGVKRWTNIMSDFCSLVLSPTHSGSLCHSHSRNIPAPSGAHRLTRSLLESLRRCYIAPVFPALVLDNHHNHYLDSHLDDKPRCCSPVRVALSVDSDLHLGTGVRERSRLIPRLRCTPRVISQRWLLKDAAVSPMARTVEPSLHKRPL